MAAFFGGEEWFGQNSSYLFWVGNPIILFSKMEDSASSRRCLYHTVDDFQPLVKPTQCWREKKQTWHPPGFSYNRKIDIFPEIFETKKISNFSKMQSPPAFAAPQLTTRRSGPTIAAKALCVAWISCTSTSCPSTCALSPPEKEAPQVTAVPSWRIAAKAYQVACHGKKWKRQHSTLLFLKEVLHIKFLLKPHSTTTSHAFKLHGDCKAAAIFIPISTPECLWHCEVDFALWSYRPQQ